MAHAFSQQTYATGENDLVEFVGGVPSYSVTEMKAGDTLRKLYSVLWTKIILLLTVFGYGVQDRLELLHEASHEEPIEVLSLLRDFVFLLFFL